MRSWHALPLAASAMLAIPCSSCSKKAPPSPSVAASSAPSSSAVASASAPRASASASASASAAAEAELPEGCGDESVAMGETCIDKLEVTTADYLACADARRCLAPATGADLAEPTRDAGGMPTALGLCNADDPSERGDHPMNCVSFPMAEAYCKQAGKRLPTGDEWMRAARGVAGGKYPWGTSSPVSSLLNACGAECVAWKRENAEALKRVRGVTLGAEMYPGDDGFAATAPVGRFAMGTSRAGALDMAGNVEEWTVDGEVRGGSWLSTRDSEARFDAHRKLAVDEVSPTVGFRCARTSKPAGDAQP